MKKNQKNATESGRKSSAATGQKSNFPILPVAIFAIGASVLIWLIMGSFGTSKTVAIESTTNNATAAAVNDNDRIVPSTNSVTEVVTDKPAAPQPLSDADRQKLLGKWERTDNPPYTIEVRLVKPDGVTDARYFNPRPINVAQAFTVGTDGQLALFMKMQDVGYEGSTYTLVYDEKQNLLIGEYFQATQGQTYEVAFQRKTE